MWIKLFVQKYSIIGITLLSIAVILSIGQYTASSFGLPRFLVNRLITVNVPIFDDVTIFNTSGWPVMQYDPHEYPQRIVLNDLNRLANNINRHIRVAILVNIPEFNDNNLFMYSLEVKHNQNLEFGGTGTYVFHSLSVAEDHLNTFDYILFSPDKAYMPYQLDVEAYRQIEVVIGDKMKSHSLELISSYLLPSSGKRIFLLKNTQPIAP